MPQRPWPRNARCEAIDISWQRAIDNTKHPEPSAHKLPRQVWRVVLTDSMSNRSKVLQVLHPLYLSPPLRFANTAQVQETKGQVVRSHDCTRLCLHPTGRYFSTGSKLNVHVLVSPFHYSGAEKGCTPWQVVAVNKTSSHVCARCPVHTHPTHRTPRRDRPKEATNQA